MPIGMSGTWGIPTRNDRNPQRKEREKMTKQTKRCDILTHTNQMYHRATLCNATAKFIVHSHLESVRKPCNEGAYVEVCLRGVSQASIWDIT